MNHGKGNEMMQCKTPAVVAIVVAAIATSANAGIIGNTNWADGVFDYSSNIQNYGGTLMTEATEFWVTGPSDADVDGNGYAWDAGDLDYVAGWRSNAPGEYIILEWNTGIPDLVGDDLTIRLYSGPNASASVFASTDGTAFSLIGTLGGGTPGYLRNESFDFAGLFAEDIHYVKVERVANGPQTGMFFDSFAGAVVPEPSTLALLGVGIFGLIRRKRSC